MWLWSHIDAVGGKKKCHARKGGVKQSCLRYEFCLIYVSNIIDLSIRYQNTCLILTSQSLVMAGVWAIPKGPKPLMERTHFTLQFHQHSWTWKKGQWKKDVCVLSLLLVCSWIMFQVFKLVLVKIECFSIDFQLLKVVFLNRMTFLSYFSWPHGSGPWQGMYRLSCRQCPCL